MKHILADGRACCDREFDKATLMNQPWRCGECGSEYAPFTSAMPGGSPCVLWLDLDATEIHE